MNALYKLALPCLWLAIGLAATPAWGQPVALTTSGYGCLPNGRSTLYTNLHVYWGDLHSHTAFSSDASNGLPCYVTPYEAFLSCTGYLDFVAVTDHAEVGTPGDYTLEKWTNYLHMIRQFMAESNGLIVYPAFEYTCSKVTVPSQDYPVPEGTGHKQVIFRDLDHVPPRAQGWTLLPEYNYPTQLWAWLDTTPAQGNYLCIIHHTAKGTEAPDAWFPYPFSMATDWSRAFMRPDVVPLVEVYSRHGSSEYAGCEEPVYYFKASNSVAYGFQLWHASGHDPAYKLGVVGSTDTHAGNPGYTVEATNNVHGVGPYTGGLAAIWAREKNQDLLWDAFFARSTYGTSGNKMGLEFSAKIGAALGGMGATLYHAPGVHGAAAAEVNLHVAALADNHTGIISRIELYRDDQLILASNTAGHVVHIDHTDILTNEYAYYRVKAWQPAWTVSPSCQFERAWSAPIWIEPRLEISAVAVLPGQLAVRAACVSPVEMRPEFCDRLPAAGQAWVLAPVYSNAWLLGTNAVIIPLDLDAMTSRFWRVQCP